MILAWKTYVRSCAKEVVFLVFFVVHLSATLEEKYLCFMTFCAISAVIYSMDLMKKIQDVFLQKEINLVKYTADSPVTK